MKYFLSACFFFCAVTQMVPAKACSVTSDCTGAAQCCSGIPPFGGFCRNLAGEGDKCQLEDTTSALFGYTIGPCSCAEGLDCIPGGTKKNQGICQKPPADPVVPVEEPAEEPAGDADDTEVAEPVADDTPAEETAAADETPAEEPAAADETPAEEPAAADETPAEEPAAEAGDSAASDSAAATE